MMHYVQKDQTGKAAFIYVVFPIGAKTGLNIALCENFDKAEFAEKVNNTK